MPRPLRWRTRSWMSPTAIGSMPAKGSSSSMKDGLPASARAISHRRRSPPDSEIDGALRNARDIEFLEQRFEHRLSRPTVGFVDLEHRADVVLDVESAEDRGFLRQIADSEPRPLKHRQPGDVMAVQFDFALVGFDEAGDHVEDGSLAGPVWPQQPHRLAPPHRKAHVLHHHSAAIALAEVMDGENALSGRRGR